MSFNNLYKINWFRFANLTVPPFLRGIKHVNWIYSWLKPLDDLNVRFATFRERMIYRVTHNSQVYSIEDVLNDSFDNTERRIYIESTDFVESLYLHPQGDDLPIIINPTMKEEQVFIYSIGTNLQASSDFVVYVPVELRPSDEEQEFNVLTRMGALIDLYKLASKKYAIVWI